jgi:Domain of unknown function (DUF4396)
VTETIAWISLLTAFACAIIISADEVRHPQHMWIMNLVWPITALYFSVFGLWAYFALGRKATHSAVRGMERTSPVYWFMMQIGMVIEYFNSYPMNHFLVRWGLKEAM